MSDSCKVMDSRRPVHLERFNDKLNRYLSLDAVNITEDEDDPLVLFTAYDITRMVESETRLKEQAFTDALTNVKNRNAFFRQLTARFEEKSTGCIGILNIKNIKRYNLLYGKNEGDKLLIKIASRFLTVYQRDKIFRIDGAKLAFLAVGDEESEQLHNIIKQIGRELIGAWTNPNFILSFDTAFVSYPDSAKSPEECGYIGQLGNFVLHEVCSLLSQRRQLGLPLMQVNINVSSIEFAGAGFSDGVIATTQQWEIPAELIQFEITESIFINSMSYVVDIMNELIAYGYAALIRFLSTDHIQCNRTCPRTASKCGGGGYRKQ